MKHQFGKILYKIRTTKEIKQIEIAKALKVSVSTISRWEKGYCEPSLEKLVELSKYLNTSINELIGLNNYKNRP